jgi:hypothetical protein
MAWDVEVSDDFRSWYERLTEDEQESVGASVDLLEQAGPMLGRPHVDTLKGSRHANMKELRIQHEGRPYRVLFAFDPRRMAYLLIGGDKTGNNRWYDEMIPVADEIYDQHLRELAANRGRTREQE